MVAAEPIASSAALPPAGLANVTSDAAAATNAAAEGPTPSISADEIALYDRQIRLWGVKAQERIRTAHILLINLEGIGNEVAKNLVLAGIGSLTVVDSDVVSEEDLGAQFFVSEDDVGRKRAEAAAPQIRKLNPRVALHISTDPIALQPPTFFTPYDVVIATCMDLDTLSTINAACRLCSRPFYAAGTHGFFGYVFADLISHEYVIEREKSNIPTSVIAETTTRSVVATSSSKNSAGRPVELVTKRELYSPLNLANTSPLPTHHLSTRRRARQVPPLLTGLRAVWEFQRLSGGLPSHSHADLELFTTLATEKHRELQLPAETLTSEFLRRFLQNLGSELAPVTAFLGGALAQDVVNVLGQREQPIQNWLLFDGDDAKAPIYALHPVFVAPVDATLGDAGLVGIETGAGISAAGVGDASGVVNMTADVGEVVPNPTVL
ncbi:MAG: hypothetical protein M1833_001570 [Piccolia ochrophora]|nr:MAG: hypothetical protein M1833_001570 [Piccolia ochrophora]